MIITFKAWKITLDIQKLNEEKITKTGISISYSGPVGSLEAAEFLPDLNKALPSKLV